MKEIQELDNINQRDTATKEVWIIIATKSMIGWDDITTNQDIVNIIILRIIQDLVYKNINFGC